jgi:GAF domain-containing protein
MPFVILLSPDGTTTSYPAGEGLSIGSLSANDVVVSRKGISRRHAKVTRETDGYWVEDCNSTNFLYHNDNQVQRHRLLDGDVFSLGDYAFLLFLDELDVNRVKEWTTKQLAQEEPGAHLEETTTRIYHKDLPKTVRELEALIEVGAQLSRISDTDSVLADVLERVLRLMRADRGFIMLIDENGELKPSIARNIEVTEEGSDELNREGQYSTSFARKVTEQRRTLVSTNVAEDPRFQSESIISQRILSIMGAPLLCADKLLGCLYIDVKETIRPYSDEDAAFLTALANQAAIAIENANLTANLTANQKSLELANTELQQSLESLVSSNQKLDRKIEEVTALYETSKKLNEASDVGAVLQKILEQTRKVIHCERTSLMMYDRSKDVYVTRLVKGFDGVVDRELLLLRAGEGIAGTAVRNRKGVIANKGFQDPRFIRRHPRDEKINSIMSVPLVSGSGDRIYGILNLTNANAPEGFTPEDLKIVQSLATMASISIDKFNGLKAMVEREKHNQEIEDAHKVQALLLPRSMPESPYFEFSARYTLANRVGGDYYDFIPMEGDRTALVIADVSGHDIASALVMAMGRNLVRTMLERYERPSEVLARTSSILRKDTHAARYITMFLAIMDPRNMTMLFSNAGHNYPLYLSRGSDSFQNLEAGGFPLGLVDDFEYMEETLELRTGDLLTLYTDGLIEAQAPDGEMYAVERLQRSILANRHEPCEHIANQIYSQVTSFAGSTQLEDDLTFVNMRVKSPKGGESA